jgi:uncharacterized protein YegL
MKGSNDMSELQASVSMTRRVIPVIILADVSESMGWPLRDGEGSRIEALNTSMVALIKVCVDPGPKAKVAVAVIAFGAGQARLAMPLTPAETARWTPVAAAGNTPLGAALRMTRQLIENPAIITQRDYRPVLVLASDGEPNDDWQDALNELDNTEEGGKADRFALAIGDLADRDMLRLFIAKAMRSNTAVAKLFEAGSEREMRQNFQAISRSISLRLKSTDPNERLPIDKVKVEGLA